jgi:hypothetical protein
MAGLVPAIHVFANAEKKQDVDARDKRGHDESNNPRFGLSPSRLRAVEQTPPPDERDELYAGPTPS